MARIEAEESELDAEIEHNVQFQQELNRLTSLKTKVVCRRRKGKHSSCAPSTSARTVCSEKLLLDHKGQSILVVSIKVDANTPPIEVNTFVEEGEAVQTV